MSNKVYTREQFLDKCLSGNLDEQEDNDGQILFYTGFYKWADGTIHDEEEPKYNVWNKNYYDGTTRQGTPKCVFTGTKEECETYAKLNVGQFASSYSIKEAE